MKRLIALWQIFNNAKLAKEHASNDSVHRHQQNVILTMDRKKSIAATKSRLSATLQRVGINEE